MTQQERRLYTRKTLNPLPYVNLPSGNGGIVLDVSEQGLRFRALAPVKKSGPIHFSFSAHSQRIEGVADLVWTDRAKKTGGLRFTQLSDHAREQIRKWPHELDLQLSVGKGFMLQIPASDDPSTAGVRGGNALDASLQFATTCSKWFGSTLRESLHSAPKDGMAESRAPRFKSRHNEWKRGISYALPVMIVVIMISLVLPYIHHRERRESLVELGARNAGEIRPNTIGKTPASNALLPAPDIGHASAEKSKVDSTPEPVNPQPASAASPVISNSKKSEPPAAQAPAANVSAPAPVAPGGKLVVQVAALTRETDARKLADSLRGKNFEAFVGTLPVDALYRVMVGPYANEASALVAVGKLKKAGIASFVRREAGMVVAGSLEIKSH